MPEYLITLKGKKQMPYKDKAKHNEWNRQWRERNPDYAKKYYEENRDHIQFTTRYNQALAMGIVRPEKKLEKVEPRVSKKKIYREAKNRPCADCGKSFPACSMDFDHVRGVKLCDVSSLSKMTAEQLVEEIAKCDIICSNCHRARTAKRKGKRKPHRVRLIESRKQFIESCKNVPCMDCKGSFHVFAMEFFHVRGKKSFGMYEACYKDTMLVIEEMEKCDIVCSNCARVRASEKRRKNKVS